MILLKSHDCLHLMDTRLVRSPRQCVLPPVGPGKRIEGGRRTRGHSKPDSAGLPRVSVVTVVLNDVAHIEATIQSVLSQTYAGIEYILVDGGSHDGTLDIVRRYDDRIDYWVSEADTGIYDAMNKGAGLASGDWVNFMNSGDRFVDARVLDSVFAGSPQLDGFELIYGDTLVIYPAYAGVSKLRRAGSLKNLWRGMQFYHQSAFFPADLLRSHAFNPDYAMAADFEVIYSAYAENRTLLHVEKTISAFCAGGVSDRSRQQVYREYQRIVRAHGKNVSAVRFYYWMKAMDCRARSWLKRVLPTRMLARVIEGGK
jgi:glycosyltransferase involved in cell wall biosynthesis